MTVNKLTVLQKETVRTEYTNKTMNITELAMALGVSTRTIGRVLVELDLATPQQTLRGEAYLVMQTLRKQGVKPAELDAILTTAKALIAQRPTVSMIAHAFVALPDTEYNQALAEIVHQREAKKHNVHVQTAMLNMQEKADQNARDNSEGRK